MYKLRFGAKTTNNGSFALVVFKTINTGSGVPDSNLHFVTTHLGWELGTFASGAFTSRGSGTYSSPLATDGATEYWCEIDRDGNTAYIRLPDGTFTTVTHAAIGTTPGQIATFETYASDAATDSKTSVGGVYADAAAIAPAGRRGDYGSDKLIPLFQSMTSRLTTAEAYLAAHRTVNYAPGTRTTKALTSSASEIDSNLRCTFVAPPSGIVELTASFWAQVPSAAWYIVSFWADAGLTSGLGTVSITEFLAAWKGTVTTPPVRKTGLTPGATYTVYTACAAATGAGNILMDGPFGYVAAVSVRPLTA
jgi:hypothetical protein